MYFEREKMKKMPALSSNSQSRETGQRIKNSGCQRIQLIATEIPVGIEPKKKVESVNDQGIDRGLHCQRAKKINSV